jgi:hypothetical protein
VLPAGKREQPLFCAKQDDGVQQQTKSKQIKPIKTLIEADDNESDFQIQLKVRIVISELPITLRLQLEAIAAHPRDRPPRRLRQPL